AFFLLAMADRLLVWRQSRDPVDAAAFAAAAGLALATKGTAYLIGLPFGLWFLAAMLTRGRRALLPLAGCALLLLLPSLALYARNLAYTGSPIGNVGVDTNNTAFGPGALVVNGARHLAVNLATQNAKYDLRLAHAVERGLAALGLDVNDPDLTFVGTRFGVSTFQNNEDIAGNPVQLILVLVAFVAVLCAGASDFPRRRYALAIAAAPLVFLIALRWQPWITRLQLPIFALAAPLTAFLPLEQRLRNLWLRAAALAPLAVLLIVTASPPLW